LEPLALYEPLSPARPVNSNSGARETILFLAGPYHNLIQYAPRSKEGNLGGVSPHHPTRGLGSVVSFPPGSGFRNGARPENGFHGYLMSERSHLEHLCHFVSNFERWLGPQTSRGPGKLLPFPVSTSLSSAVSETSHVSYGDSHLFHPYPTPVPAESLGVLLVFPTE